MVLVAYGLVFLGLVLSLCVRELFLRDAEATQLRQAVASDLSTLRREFDSLRTEIRNWESFGEDEPRVLKRLAEIIQEATSPR